MIDLASGGEVTSWQVVREITARSPQPSPPMLAAVATNEHGQEGAILRFVFWHSIALATLVGVLTLLQAYWLPWMIPHLPPTP